MWELLHHDSARNPLVLDLEYAHNRRYLGHVQLSSSNQHSTRGDPQILYTIQTHHTKSHVLSYRIGCLQFTLTTMPLTINAQTQW